MGSAAWCTSKEKTGQFSVVPNCPIILKLLLGQQIWHWWSNSTRICVLSQRVQNSCKFGCYLEMKPMRDTPWEDISQELILFTKNYDLFREHQKLEPMAWADFAILKSTHFLARVCSPFGQLWEIWALSLTNNLIFFFIFKTSKSWARSSDLTVFWSTWCFFIYQTGQKSGVSLSFCAGGQWGFSARHF